MKIMKFFTKRKVIIGAVAGVSLIAGVVALFIRHKKKKGYAFIKSLLDEDDEFCDEDDIEEEYCGAKERCCTYAKNKYPHLYE